MKLTIFFESVSFQILSARKMVKDKTKTKSVGKENIVLKILFENKSIFIDFFKEDDMKANKGAQKGDGEAEKKEMEVATSR